MSIIQRTRYFPDYVEQDIAVRKKFVFPKVFISFLIVAWILSLTPLSESVRSALSTVPSIVVGCLLGIWVFLFARGIQWLYLIIYIVFVEQIFVVSSSFIDEMIILFLIPKLFFKKTGSTKHKSTLPLLGFVVFAILSALINSVPYDVFLASLRSYLQYMLIFLFLLSSNITRDDIDKILSVILTSAIFFSLVGFIGLVTGRSGYVGRAEGVMSNPNALAGFLVFAIPLLWFHYTEKQFLPWIKGFFFKFIGILTFLVFVSTGSRSMIAGLGGGLLLVVFIRLGAFKRKLKFAVLILCLSIAGYFLTEGYLFYRFSEATSSSYYNPETNLRAYYTSGGWRLFQENPLIGVGPGRYGGSVATIFPSPVYYQYGIMPPSEFGGITQGDVFYPHLLAEIGVFGLVFFLWLIMKPILAWLKLVFSGRKAWTPMTAAITASLISILFSSLGGPYLELHLTALFYWIFLAILILEIAVQKQKQSLQA